MDGGSTLAPNDCDNLAGELAAGKDFRCSMGRDRRRAGAATLAGRVRKPGPAPVFDALSDALTAEREDVSYETLGRELGAGTPEIKRLLYRLRQRYRQLLREEVAETLARPEDVDDELRYLVAALAAGEQRSDK